MSEGLSSGAGRGVAPWVRQSARVLLHLVPAVLLMTGAWVAGCSCEDEAGGDEGQIRSANRPELVVNPTEITFSAATPDSPETRSIVLNNVGNGDLTRMMFSLSPDTGVFTVETQGLTVLKPNESQTITVSYRPDPDGVTQDTATLTISGSGGESEAVLLNSLPPRREVQCEPDPLVISGVSLGESRAVPVKIANIGNLPVTIERLSLEFGLVFSLAELPEGEAVLDPGDDLTVSVVFTPESGGTEEDVLRIVAADEAEAFECTVRGITPLPLIGLNPSRIDFGNVPVGESVRETVTVTNTGSAVLNLTGLDFLRGTSEDFAYAMPLSGAQEISPGEEFAVEIVYTASDATASGTAVFLSNDPTQPQAAVPLLGRPSRPDLVVSPTSLSFGEVGQGISVVRTLSLFNNGTEPLEVSQLVVDGTPEFAVVADANFPPSQGAGVGVIAPQGEVMLQVRFTPVDLGADIATLNIRSNDPSEPLKPVPMTATGGQQARCRIRVIPDPMNFGLVTRGSTRTVMAQIRNVGSGFCRFDSAQVANPAVFGFGNMYFTMGAVSLRGGESFGPGEAVSVEVNYTPLTLDLINIHTATLGVNITDPVTNELVTNTNGEQCQMGSPFACGAFMAANAPAALVPMQGFAGISELAVIPGTVDFGLVTLGCASQNTTVTLYNTGTADLVVDDIRLDAACGSEFELRALPIFPSAITPQNPVPFQVIYRPANLGRDFCDVIIESNASESEPLFRVPISGEGTNLSRQIDTFEQVSGRKVDVLFAIDGSGSMEEEQDNVARNLDAFLNTAELFDTDFQIGVTHLDLGETKRYGGDNFASGELIGSPPFLTPGQANYRTEFASRIRLGASGGQQEAGLEAARQALSDPLITQTNVTCSNDSQCEVPYNFCRGGVCSGRNGGFLREDASLEIVLLSDEEDQSTATPEFYVDFFRSIKGFRNDSLMHVSSIVGADTSGNPSDCSASGSGDAAAGRRYATVSTATNGTVGSICSTNFGPFLQNIGNRAFGLRIEFFLSRAAEPATIEVRVNDVRQATGWTYDAATNSIVFNRNSVPQPGQIIEVEYEARCFR
jgi:hypothetical protein